MAEFIYGTSDHHALGPHVILAADDVKDVSDAALRLRQELARPTAKTVGEFKRFWEPLFVVNFGFYEGYVETGRDMDYIDEVDLEDETLESMMAWSDSPTTIRVQDGLKARYRTYDTYYCMRAVGPDSDVHSLVAPYLRVGWRRCAVVDIEPAVEALRSAGHDCRNDEDTIKSVFGRLTTLEFLADGLTDFSMVTKETLLGLPDSIIEMR